MKASQVVSVAGLCLLILGPAERDVPVSACPPTVQEYDQFGDPLPEPDLPYHEDDADEQPLANEQWAEYLAERDGCTDYFYRVGVRCASPGRQKDSGVRPGYFAHGGPVVAVAFAPDGKTVATGTGAYTFTELREGLVRVWDPSTGKLLRLLVPHGPAVTSLAFSPDGKLLAAASWDAQLHVWDVATGQVRHCLEHPAGVASIAFAPDGKTLAAATLASRAGYQVHLWDLATGKLTRRLQGRSSHRWEAPVLVCYTPDGTTLLAKVRDDGPLAVWDVASGREGADIPWGGRLEAFVFAPDGRTLALDGGGDIVLIDFPSGTERCRIPGEHRWTTWGFQPGRLAFSPDGRTLAGVGRDNLVTVWEVSTGKERYRAAVHTDHAAAVAFAPDGRSLITGSMDETARISDVTGWHQWHGPLAKELDAEEMPALWKSLASDDASAAHTAVWALVRCPKQAVPFLSARLRPDPAVERRIELLIADLNSERFAVRQRATTALEALAEATEGPLRKALQKGPPLEVSRRIEQLLERLERQLAPAQRARRQRALEVLGQINTPEAWHILEALGLARRPEERRPEK